jgi:hypothetical protein
MKNSTSLSLLIAAAATLGALPGCYVATGTALETLGTEGSHAVVARGPVETATEVTRLLASRGYALVDSQPDGAGLRLAFKGNREQVTTSTNDIVTSTQFGSAFYAWITPTATGQAEVALEGGPIVNGEETCPRQGRTLVCRSVLNNGVAGHVSGGAEAEVIHGVLTELGLETAAR